MSTLRRLLIYALAFLVPPVLVGGWGVHELLTRERPEQLPRASTALLVAAPRPTIDPERPSVVVVLGADITEVTDALGPYEMFARTGGFNVVTAAAERRPTLLTGGLAVLPHYSLAELDAQLAGRSPAIVVVPNIPNIDAAANAPIVAWLRKQARRGSLMHSWCKGAMALAEAGLLDGRSATAHWGDIDKLERRYPRVRWVRGVRWIEHEGFMISAGITSGIDASLRLIGRLTGDETARRVAREIRYPNYHYALDPRAAQFKLEVPDTVLLAKAAFGVRESIALLLYPGVGELDLSNIYDAHAYVMAARVHAVAGEAAYVQSAHGLTLLPSLRTGITGDEQKLAKVRRIVVPGPRVSAGATALLASLKRGAADARVHYLHADEPLRFGLEPVIEDLARTSDIATARFALRRMEYRSSTVRLSGRSLPWEEFAAFALVGVLGVAAVSGVGRFLGRRLGGQGRMPRDCQPRAGGCNGPGLATSYGETEMPMPTSPNAWFRYLVLLTALAVPSLASLPSRAESPAQAEAVREIEIVVDGGAYKPNRVEIHEGERVRLKFVRKEYNSCTKDVVLPQLNIKRELPPNKPVIIELPALKAGEYEYRCGMNMIRGSIVVTGHHHHG